MPTRPLLHPGLVLPRICTRRVARCGCSDPAHTPPGPTSARRAPNVHAPVSQPPRPLAASIRPHYPGTAVCPFPWGESPECAPGVQPHPEPGPSSGIISAASAPNSRAPPGATRPTRPDSGRAPSAAAPRRVSVATPAHRAPPQPPQASTDKPLSWSPPAVPTQSPKSHHKYRAVG